MAYLTVKKVKGRYYGYMQESYREGGSVRTRTVEYLGAMEPAVAQQVQATRKQLGQADMSALVQSVRKASQTATRAPESATQPQETATPLETTPEPPQPRYEHREVNGRPQLIDMRTGELIESEGHAVITTESAKPTLRPFADSLKLPKGIETHKLSRAAIHGTHRKFGARLKAIQINPAAMPDVVIKYGHPDSLKQQHDGSYIVTTSRKPKRGHTLNKAKLWQHYRQALSNATIDAIESERPELYAHMQSQLSESHQNGKRLLFQHIAQTTSGIQRLGLSLQLILWDRVALPRAKKGQKTSAEDLGQYSFETINDWRDEASQITAEAHKLGWSKMIDKSARTVAKHKAAITKTRREIDGLSRLDKLAGKRRKLLREIMQTETKLAAASQLQKRIKIIEPIFNV